MKTRLFYTTGNRDIIETTWDKPEPTGDEIEVQAILTGVCRSDIDMYTGDFPMLPKEIQGHEGLGKVTKIGKDVQYCPGLNVGDYVATRGEPAFSDYYNVNKHEFSVVSDAEPKYILEPVACGLNLLGEQADNNSNWLLEFDPTKGNTWDRTLNNTKEKTDILILGTGFLATTLFTGIVDTKSMGKCNITVVGNANKDFWMKQNINFVQDVNEITNDARFDMIYDITSRPSNIGFVAEHICDAGSIIMASEKKPNPPWPMQELLWKSATVVFPSPRSVHFEQAMHRANDMIACGTLDTAKLWTQGYDRGTEVKKAFEDGLNRQEGYSRGYIRW